MARKSRWKRAIRLLLGLAILYLIVWGIGFYRVWSFERALRQQHRERGEAVEQFISKLQVGQSAELLSDFQYSAKGESESEYVIWYYSFIDEDSSVSNRGGPVYRVRVGSGVVISVDKSMPMSHGDKFSSPFHYYPSVALFGLDTDDNN